jgi:phosphoribosylaminoimidazolecarboxamide formyltransferase/IMP cyclohydrolase
MNNPIKTALISVYHKDGLAPVLQKLHQLGVKLVSTGGTQKYIEELSLPVIPAENLTGFPSIFGGRVKTLHPNILGGILFRRDIDAVEAEKYGIESIDLVIVDLYPFEATLASGASHEEIIEKIDIGGISLIRAAAKNFNDVSIIASRESYADLLEILEKQGNSTTLAQRRNFAARAFAESSHYDGAIFNYFNQTETQPLNKIRLSLNDGNVLRYGENPHQKAEFYGKINELFEQLNGKELSFNNLTDTEAAVDLLDEFSETAFVIVKHTNACGCATGESVKNAYLKAFAADTLSAFGGVLACNKKVDAAAAEELNKLFFEILIAPDFEEDALNLLKSKKNRILLRRKNTPKTQRIVKTMLNGFIVQDKDLQTETDADLKVVTQKSPEEKDIKNLIFASKIAKHTKSNTIVLAVDGQLLASGVGQTSRVDALKQAVEKAKSFGFDLKGAAMASDAFFPFPDCVEIAYQAGIRSVIQPGGSLKDQESVDFCDKNGMSMVLTGFRHFKH